MATSAQFTAAPAVDISQISTANTSRDGSGTTVEVCAGPSATAGNGVGKRIIRVSIQATGTTTAGVVRFFYSADSGSTKRLIEETLVPAITPSTSVAAFRTEVAELVGLVLPGGNTHKLYASTNNAETFNILIESGTL